MDKLRGRFLRRFVPLAGKSEDTTDALSTADTVSPIFENVSDDGEEVQSETTADGQGSDTELDMWAEAEKKLREDDKKRCSLEEFDKILEKHLGAKLKPLGTQARRNQFSKFLASEVEKLNRAEKGSNATWGKCKRKAKRCFETAAKVVVASKDIIAPAANACLPAGVACTGVVILLSFCLKGIEQRQVLFESLEYVSGSIHRIAEYEALCRSGTGERDKATDDAFIDVCCNIVEFQARVLCFLQGNPVASAIRNTFELNGWSKLLSGMKDAETRVKACAERKQMSNVAEIYNKVDDILKFTNKLLQHGREQEVQARNEKANDFLQLLYRNACEYVGSKERNGERALGTCDWFTNHDLFTSWDSGTFSGESNLLYVTADPGCGKSVLSKYLVNEILPDDNRTVCYFFFKDDFEQQKTAKSAVCTLLHQMFDKNHRLLTPDVLRKYEARGEMLVESFGDLWNLFLDAANHQAKSGEETVCVLDALDECRASDMIQLIQAVTGTRVPGLKFLLPSRPYTYIRRAFASGRTSFIHLQGDGKDEANEIAEEIKIVVKSRVDKIAYLYSLTPNEHKLMGDQLASVPNRTYLWVSLVFDGLMAKDNIAKKDIVNLTKQLPQSIYAAYEKILRKSKDRQKSKRLLHLILGAERPLTLSEVSVALELDHLQSWAELDDRIIPSERVKATIRDLCGLFVTTVDDRVYLLHQTAREFLLYKTSDKSKEKELSDLPQSHDNSLARLGTQYWFLFLALVLGIAQPVFHQLWLFMTNSWQHSMHLTESNEVLAATCIAFLQLDHFSERTVSMLEYAAMYWPAHYRQSGAKFRFRMGKETGDLCLPHPSNARWTAIYQEREDLPDHPLSMASCLGIDGAVKAFLDKKISTTTETDVNIDFKSTVGSMTPLSWAASKGYEAAFKLLLSTGLVDIDSKDNYGLTPFSLAARNRHEAVVKLLLSTGQVDIDFKDENGQTPFSWAACNGHEAIVKLLLSTGQVDIDSKDEDGLTPFSWAACNGHEAIVKLLLSTGQVDIDLKDNYGQTPFSWAAYNGHEAIVKLLLSTRQVDIDSKDGDGRTPFSLAAYNGHEAIVKLLLSTGQVDIDSKDNYGRTPFSLAACDGHEAIVKLFLSTGQVDIDSKDEYGRTPLSLADERGHETIVELLRANGATKLE